MSRDRLEHGKKVLERLKTQGVSDGNVSTSTNKDRLLMVDWDVVHGCNTVAYIAGWFTLDPDFIEQGLTSTRALDQNDFLVPVYGQLVDDGALKAFFDISEAQCDHIFGGTTPTLSVTLRYASTSCSPTSQAPSSANCATGRQERPRMDRRELRRAVVGGALQLAEQINVQIEPNAYAVRYGTQGSYTFCILGALAYVAMSPRLLGEVTLETTKLPEAHPLEAERPAGVVRSVREAGITDLFDFQKAPDFIHGVLTLLWDVEDVALIETAFMGEVVYYLGSRIGLKSAIYNL